MILENGIADFYKEYLKLLKEAPEVECRGFKTRELTNVHFSIPDPTDRLVHLPCRKFNLPFAITEAYLLAIKTNYAIYATAFNKNMMQFAERDTTMFTHSEHPEQRDFFYGAYGYRIAESIPEIIEKLRKDPTTRQAVLTIHRIQDSFSSAKDVPCTIALQFLIRNNRLELYVYMRSNDAIWGTPYDVFMFTILQEIVANTLRISMGSYYHNVTSLHIYEKHYKMADEILESIEAGKIIRFGFPTGMNYLAFKQEAYYFFESITDMNGIKNIIYNKGDDFTRASWMLSTLMYAQDEKEAVVSPVLSLFMKDYHSLKKVT